MRRIARVPAKLHAARIDPPEEPLVCTTTGPAPGVTLKCPVPYSHL